MSAHDARRTTHAFRFFHSFATARAMFKPFPQPKKEPRLPVNLSDSHIFVGFRKQLFRLTFMQDYPSVVDAPLLPRPEVSAGLAATSPLLRKGYATGRRGENRLPEMRCVNMIAARGEEQERRGRAGAHIGLSRGG